MIFKVDFFIYPLHILHLFYKMGPRTVHDHIFDLQIRNDKFARQFLTQKQRVSKLDAQLSSAREKVKELRRLRNVADTRGGGANAVKSCLALETKEISKLENRLSANKIRQSTMIARNNVLRGDVDKLRQHRVLSLKVNEKNKRRLKDIEKLMQESFEESNELMQERDQVKFRVHCFFKSKLI